ncbi:MAG TPA: hypothetical protein VFR36_01505 [Sphingomicrobium sp.]|nr:hypothetical protein [Sphingomicrobium sp.]
MVSVSQNAQAALDAGFNLTANLRHADVKALAEEWFPKIRFHYKERFHPIDLKTLFTAPKELFDGLTEPARDALRITISGPLGEQRYNPPVVRNGSDVRIHGGNINVDPTIPGDGTEPMGEPPIDKETIYSHGDSYERSKQLFGASDTMSGLPDPVAGDPRAPRHPVEVRAEMRFLLEALKHELQEEIPNDPLWVRPDDALWGRFDIVDLFFLHPMSPIAMPHDAARAFMRALIAAHENEDTATQAALIGSLDPLFQFNTRAWNAVKNYAFLEFYYFYAYNDFDQYGDWPFVNTHEGDLEGCCVVFERRQLVEFAQGDRPFEEVIGHTIITSVHEEMNDSDELKRLPLGRQDALDDLVVYVAPGSHATYLTVGSHDFTDWEDVLTDWPGLLPTWVKVLAALAALTPIGRAIILAIVLIVLLAEHFIDSEDETVDNGVSAGPGPDPQPGTTAVAKRLFVTPLSNISLDPMEGGDVNIYHAAISNAPASDDVDAGTLARRAYQGWWGGSNGLISHSGGWENKTKRYFKKFLSKGQIEAELIT